MTRTNMKEDPSKSVWTSFNRQRISLTVFFHWWIKLAWLENLTLVKLSMFVCHSFLGFLVARIIFASVIAKFFINMAFATIYVFSTELFPTVVRYCCIGFFLSVRLRGHNRAVDLFIYFKSRRKIVHPFAALTCEIFFNTRREILYLQAAM